jgi:glyoxylase-like metal-dependent hydrolase (beta-lactamase superfamily II)/acid stress-induced BolA-like protein IbaG/YrbA
MPGLGRFVVVDPGSDERSEIERLLAVIERRRETGAEPAAIVLTHDHHDHTAGAARVAAELGLPILAHPATLERIGPACGPVQQPLAEGDPIDIGGAALRVLHTPGHAPGHVALAWPERRVVVAGDLLSGRSTILIDPARGDMGAYLESLARLDALDAEILPGHGPPLSAREARRAITHRRMREARILERIGSAPAALEVIASQAYADAPGLPAALTERQCLAHLRLLEREGRVQVVEESGRQLWRRPAGEPAARRIERRLAERLELVHFELHDDSARHAGHPGASGGGGHYRVVVVSPTFEGRTRLERHRMVHAALRELFEREIHALEIAALAPAEWGGGEPG